LSDKTSVLVIVRGFEILYRAKPLAIENKDGL
jgi:hypothetical protein